jgi:hypothetical protein
MPILKHQMRISTNKVSPVMRLKSEKKIGKLKEPKKQSAMKLSHIPRRINRAMHEGDNPSF